MLGRIRQCFGLDNQEQMQGEIEADEAYVGGKDKNRHANKKSYGTRQDKSPVLGMIERNGRLSAKQVPNTTTETLSQEIIKNVKEGATLYTDEYSSYKALQRIYDHQFVKHSRKEYVNGRIHTNTIESFWSILKRGIVGVYHFTSKKHLQLYIDEFVFRYNSRMNTEASRFNLLLTNTENRITYKQLING